MQELFSFRSQFSVLLLGAAFTLACTGTRDVGDTGPSVDPGAESTSALPGDVDKSEDSSQSSSRKKRYRKSGSKVTVGDKALDLSGAVNASGKEVSLEDKQAPLLVLTFGASWCAPCKKELPALEKLAGSFERSKVDFVAVNIDTSIASGKKFMNSFGFSRLEAVFDPKNRSVGRYDPPTMPSVYIVREGIVKHVHAGFRSGDAAKLKKMIEQAQ